MDRRAGAAAAPIYLFICLLAGGSSQAILGTMVLQLAGLGLLCWAALARDRTEPTRDGRLLWLLALGAATLMLVQLVPLPPALWTTLPGREFVVDGYRVLGVDLPWAPISLDPYATLAALLSLIPPLAMLAAITLLRAYRSSWLALGLAGAMAAGIMLGALQVASADPLTSSWYLYPSTNHGRGVGFFANANHMATLLLVSLPFGAAMLAKVRVRRGNLQRNFAATALLAISALLVVIGIALNGSTAGYGLAIPVVLASGLILVKRRSRAARWLFGGALALVIGAVALLLATPTRTGALTADAQSSYSSRERILATSLVAARDFSPIGSGGGTFERAYALHDDPFRANLRTVVNHAHNDYVEVLIEYGVAGAVLMLLFAVWWLRTAVRVWRAPESRPFARAGAVASATILVHSIVDFPLRTTAIAVLFAACLGLMVQGAPRPRRHRADLWETRHAGLD